MRERRGAEDMRERGEQRKGREMRNERWRRETEEKRLKSFGR